MDALEWFHLGTTTLGQAVNISGVWLVLNIIMSPTMGMKKQMQYVKLHVGHGWIMILSYCFAALNQQNNSIESVAGGLVAVLVLGVYTSFPHGKQTPRKWLLALVGLALYYIVMQMVYMTRVGVTSVDPSIVDVNSTLYWHQTLYFYFTSYRFIIYTGLMTIPSQYQSRGLTWITTAISLGATWTCYTLSDSWPIVPGVLGALDRILVRKNGLLTTMLMAQSVALVVEALSIETNPHFALSLHGWFVYIGHRNRLPERELVRLVAEGELELLTDAARLVHADAEKTLAEAREAFANRESNNANESREDAENPEVSPA